jgi:hypothetical protein
MKKRTFLALIIIFAIILNFSFYNETFAKSRDFSKILKILDDSNLTDNLLNNSKLGKVKAKLDKFTDEYAPNMRGKSIKELSQYFMGKKFLMQVIQDKILVKMNGQLYNYDIRVDLLKDANGKISPQIRPLIEAKNPPNTSPINEKEIISNLPKWSGSGTMVLTNTSILRQKHPKNFQKIMALLNGFGPIIDVNSSNWKTIDNIVEKRFDKKKYNSLFIFGGSDVIPFGTFDNPVSNIRAGDLDKIIYSDDHYADFNHDKFTDWEIMVSRLPDDNGILQNTQSVLYKKVPNNNKPKFKKFAVYGNQNWRVSDRISQLGNGEIKYSLPTTEHSFNPSYFNGRNVVLTLHGAKRDGAHYWGEAKKSIGQYRGKTATAMNLNHAIAPDSIILSGCCYGAYIDGRTNNSDNRLALRFLRNGARAYIGNTGIGWIGGTTSRTTGLWAKLYIKYIKSGNSPQKAFFLSKRAYATQSRDPYNFKMLHQYIYLGLPPVNKGIAKTNDIEKSKKPLYAKKEKYTIRNSKKVDNINEKASPVPLKSKVSLNQFSRNFVNSIEERDINNYMNNFTNYVKLITPYGKKKEFKDIKSEKQMFFIKNRRIKTIFKIENSKFNNERMTISYKLTYRCEKSGRRSGRRNEKIVENGEMKLINAGNKWMIEELKIRN